MKTVVTGISVDATHINRPIIVETTKRSKILCIKNPNLGIIICCDDPQRSTAKWRFSYKLIQNKIFLKKCLHLAAYAGLR